MTDLSKLKIGDSFFIVNDMSWCDVVEIDHAAKRFLYIFDDDRSISDTSHYKPHYKLSFWLSYDENSTLVRHLNDGLIKLITNPHDKLAMQIKFGAK
jgi:hypothetical protein